jgi:predicted nicotinamide N-methyase
VPGYSVKIVKLRIDGRDYRLRTLSDRQQFADPDGVAERAGIGSASWPLFGMLWPAAHVLAEAVSVIAIEGLRILEIGCGIGLPSLVLRQRGADITASDHHPLAGSFLAHNATLNALPPIPFVQAAWADLNSALGRFDLIIASDVLYERGQAELLADFIARHAQPRAGILVTDPGRGYANQLGRRLREQGYAGSESRCRFEETEKAPFRGRLLSYRRDPR